MAGGSATRVRLTHSGPAPQSLCFLSKSGDKMRRVIFETTILQKWTKSGTGRECETRMSLLTALRRGRLRLACLRRSDFQKGTSACGVSEEEMNPSHLLCRPPFTPASSFRCTMVRSAKCVQHQPSGSSSPNGSFQYEERGTRGGGRQALSQVRLLHVGGERTRRQLTLCLYLGSPLGKNQPSCE